MQSAEKRNKTDLASLEPAYRVKQLANYGAMVEVDSNVPPRRSGLEMVRMANVYLAEGSLENAYILYLKFMTLFLEKIRKHPEYSTIPADIKAVNQSKLKEVKRRKAEEAKKKQEQEDAKLAQILQADENKKDGHTTPHLLHPENWAVTPSAPPVDGVVYPDDFAVEPPRPPPHHYQPSPPLIPPSRPLSGEGFDMVPLSADGGLRSVVVPSTLLARFLTIAASNTAKNIETCGILAGVLNVSHIRVDNTAPVELVDLRR
ncbi:unnamed protein product [Leptidea sinapis]|uniref:USP8 dimerisation domain-containing protein n=1 Tax=Leptidea sinapis TaxID=189913 RepID=A0A5E4R2P7_9NEOP|nr:unnamed protein product [Leptidea sinapis]